MDELACQGGPRSIDAPLAAYDPLGAEEREAVLRVMDSGVLSAFLGSPGEGFLGGPEVRAFEEEWQRAFEIEHAVSVNSATSGLMAAVGAVGVEPGDEVIVSPWTMSASATAILLWNAIPVFADIEPETFNLDPARVRALVTPRTRAIVVPDIFGHGARMDEILAIARDHGLKVIEDAAQAPGALDRGRRVGTLGDIGVYSLNYHKHIHTGEGGICVTRDPRLARRMQLIRNHGEVVVEGDDPEELQNILGFNFRLTELQAAIGRAQLAKLDRLVTQRVEAADRLTTGLATLEGLHTPVVRDGCTHVYYVYPLVLSEALAPKRGAIARALAAEGLPELAQGYVVVHRYAAYRSRILYGRSGFPWKGAGSESGVVYGDGVCPVAESLHDERFLGIELCAHRYAPTDVDRVVSAFHKVWHHMDSLG